MLAKITAKNQLTLPKAVTAAVGPAEYFDVETKGGQIILTPVRLQRADAVRAKLAELDLTGSGHRRRRGLGQEEGVKRPPRTVLDTNRARRADVLVFRAFPGSQAHQGARRPAAVRCQARQDRLTEDDIDRMVFGDR